MATFEVQARRASNTRLLPEIDALLKEHGFGRDRIACVAVGRGPGSFTGVRIAMATAKGVASALGVGLIGVSTLDAVAWNAWAKGVRGRALVVADAMRHEVYPVRYLVDDAGAHRTEPDSVVKAAAAAESLSGDVAETVDGAQLQIMGDALSKYADVFQQCGIVLDESLWSVTGRGLLLALQESWRAGESDPFDAKRHDPAFALPVYTRLSDAEENERVRLSKDDPRNLVTGVQDIESDQVLYRPLDAAHVADVAKLEARVMEGAPWTEKTISDELAAAGYLWWAAFSRDEEGSAKLVAYVGGLVAGDVLEVLRVGTDPEWRRRGIARELIAHLASNARDLGAQSCMLEVRADNKPAQALYESIGLERVGVRAKYYDNAVDAVIMNGPLPVASHDVGGMEVQDYKENEAAPQKVTRPLIIAIESSCDETAASIVDGEGNLLADVVASQIDFHSRFGGVVPEIASRKHIEAICGVCDECFDVAAAHLGVDSLTWTDLDAVSVTYAPGLVGALVVGVAFAKGAAWAADKPFIGVNHLEGRLVCEQDRCARP